MNPLKPQRGQLLVAGIILIVVVALMIATLGYLYVSGQSAGILHRKSDQAYFAARSGIEYAARQYFNGTACSGLNDAGVQVGIEGATFTLTPTLYAPLSPTATSAALTAASSSIPVTSTAGYAPHGRVLVDSELVNYTSTTATSFDGLTRGTGGTTAAAHASGATVSQNVCQIQSRGDAGNSRRIVEAALGAGTMDSPGALGTMGVDAMVVYGKGTSINTAGTADRNVYFRLWDASAGNWGAEQTAQQVGANSSPVFITVQFARTRNEAIMGVLDGNNRIYIQVWNGRTWTIPAGGGPLSTASTLCASAPTVANTPARCFQIAYEYTSDIARIVYQENSRDPKYATWNGTTLTANGLVFPPSGTYPANGGSSRQLWFRLAPRNVAGSNDILLMTSDDRQDIYGARWTGAAWSNMGTAARWDTSTSNGNNRNAIDVAWQSNNAVALFVYGDATTRQIGYRTWTAATSTLGALSSVRPAFPAGYTAAVFEWLRLYPGPSNVILAVGQTENNNTRPALLSMEWNSGAWSGAYTGHEDDALVSATDRNFIFAWEQLPSASGKGWLIWGSNTAGGVRQRYLTAPAAWSAIGTTVIDDTLMMQAGVLSPSGRFVAGMYQATASTNDDIVSATTTGGGTPWPNASTQLWAGPTTVQQGERVYVVAREGARINTGASGTGVVSILQSEEP
jgi:hypothetical protein